MIFAGLRPTAEELEQMYSSYPLHSGLNPITRKRYEELLEIFSAVRQTGALLDAGSGSGYFLDVALEKGWTVHGSEYDISIVRQCRQRGINMWEGALDSKSFSADAFDVVTSFEVLEHLVDPIKELENFRRMLRSGGILYITTPNFNSVSRLLAGRDWNIVNFPEHLNYFTPHTLKKALKISGFKVRDMRTTGISPSRILASKGKEHFKETEANTNPLNSDQRLRGRIERSRLLKIMKRGLNGILQITGTGDTLKVYCT